MTEAVGLGRGRMTSAFCEQCRAPVSEAAKFCLRCGARTGRHPTNSFKFLSLAFFVLVGALLSTSLLLRLTPRTSAGPGLNVSGVVWQATAQDATVVADSFCSESDTEILRLYALIAQHDRRAAAALVVRDSIFAMSAGTEVHEYNRTGRLSRIRVLSSDPTSVPCWIPTIMLSSAVKRGTGTPIGQPVR